MEQENQFIDKKQFTLSIMLLVGLMLTLFIALFVLLNNKIESVNSRFEESKPVFENTTTTTNEDTIYTIKEFNGKIGVYLNDDFQYHLDIYVSTLPEKDKQLLSKGITATSEQELNEILSVYY